MSVSDFPGVLPGDSSQHDMLYVHAEVQPVDLRFNLEVINEQLVKKMAPQDQ